MSTIECLKSAILDLDRDAAVHAAQALVNEGGNAMDGVNAMGDALCRLGDRFRTMKVFLPEMLPATEAFKAALEILEPELTKSIESRTASKRAKTSPAGRRRKRPAAVPLAVGADMPDAAEEFGSRLIGLSVLMSPADPSRKEVIDFLISRGVRGRYKVIVGGNAFERAGHLRTSGRFVDAEVIV